MVELIETGRVICIEDARSEYQRKSYFVGAEHLYKQVRGFTDTWFRVFHADGIGFEVFSTESLNKYFRKEK